MTVITLPRGSDRVDQFLRRHMRTRHWSVPQLADHCDVSIGMVTKWISENPRYRVTPSPASCEKIASGLGVDLDEVLAIAGHRPAQLAAKTELSARQRAILDQAERWNAAVGPGREEYFWRTLIAHGDSTVALMQELGTAVNDGTRAAVNAAVKRGAKRGPVDGAEASRTLRSRLPTTHNPFARLLFGPPALAAV